MTIQEKIDENVKYVSRLLEISSLSKDNQKAILSAVKELGIQWQAANANARAAVIILGLTENPAMKQYAEKYILECLALRQVDELKKKEDAGNNFISGIISPNAYLQLVDLLMVQAIEDTAQGAAKAETETAEKKSGGSGTAAKKPAAKRSGKRAADAK